MAPWGRLMVPDRRQALEALPSLAAVRWGHGASEGCGNVLRDESTAVDVGAYGCFYGAVSAVAKNALPSLPPNYTAISIDEGLAGVLQQCLVERRDEVDIVASTGDIDRLLVPLR